ncbi:MAG: Gfo/Idh/MocA family oxidoreductase [Dehalococcoidia bacterium]
METINVGLIGMGKMGILHGGILCSLDGVVPKSLADSETRLHKFVSGIMPQVNIYSDYHEMLEKEKLDLVYITTPTRMHPDMAEACADRGINFFVEKPLGISCEQCVPLLKKVRQKPVINMVGYCYHFIETFMRAKEIIEQNTIGDLIYLNSYSYISQALSLKGKHASDSVKETGGVLNQLATHLVDNLLWLFGDVAEVQGSVKSYYSTDVEDFAHAHLRFESGLEGYLDTSWSLRGYRLPEIRIEVEGAKGKLTVTESYVRTYLDKTGDWVTNYNQDLYQGVVIDVGGPFFTREDQHMVTSVMTGTNTGLDVEYAYRVQMVTDAIYESANTGRRTEVSSFGA